MSEIADHLKEKIQEAETIRKIQAYAVQLRSRLSEEDQALQIMEQTLAKEQRDVELLEKEGLTTIFHKFLGDREEQLQKERQDYLTASLRYNELFKSVEVLKYELEVLTRKEQNLNKVEKEIASLIKQRETELIQFEPEVAAQLKALHEQVDKLHKFEIEVNQALSTGDDALAKVRKTEYYLMQGQSPDLQMWRGSDQSRVVNHKAVDRARDMAYQSKQALIRFGNELRDVFPDQHAELNMDIEDFKRFAEFFINNLITDWIIRQKISKSLISVRTTGHQIEIYLQSLNQQKQTIANKLEELESKRKEIIILSGKN